MSLFSSKFDPGPSAAPQASPQGGVKRKRPSAGAKGGLIKQTEVNLGKLMKKVENGDVKDKVQGTERMGGGGKRQKNDRRESVEVKRPQEKKPFKKEAKSPQVKSQSKDIAKKGKSATTSSPAKTTHDPLLPPAVLPMPNITVPKASHADEVELTDLQKSMRAKLDGARFRWINEQLYSTPSTEAVEMMKADPKIFADYHQTHRHLTAHWPSPPLPHLLALLSPLPPRSLIVDLGCGDAELARTLVPEGKIVLSYDLVGDSGVPAGAGAGSTGGEGWVVEADFLERVPLPGRPGTSTSKPLPVAVPKKKKGKQPESTAQSEVVDAVVCCLSLMGVNWVGGIYEACRILKQGGSFHIAEVTSRFVSTEHFVEKVSSFGFNLEKQTSPSTHFTLFTFTKTADVPQGAVRGQKGWNERVAEGEAILRGCVYKKR